LSLIELTYSYYVFLASNFLRNLNITMINTTCYVLMWVHSKDDSTPPFFALIDSSSEIGGLSYYLRVESREQTSLFHISNNNKMVSGVCGRLVSFTTLPYTAYTAVDNRLRRPKGRPNPFISRVSCRRVNKYLGRLIRRKHDV